MNLQSTYRQDVFDMLKTAEEIQQNAQNVEQKYTLDQVLMAMVVVEVAQNTNVIENQS
jgi:hypothetical protein